MISVEQYHDALRQLERAEARVAELETERNALAEEVMRHQVGESYDVGHEHGSAVAAKFKADRDAALAKIAGRNADQARFWRKVDRTDACWLWTAGKNSNGYGTFRIDDRMEYAHRVVYEWVFGPIPEGLQIDHLCRTRLCVNPSHLEVVTQRENILRGESVSAVNAVKTHCVNGHEFTEANTYISTDGSRVCRECRNIDSRNRRARVDSGTEPK